jgi:hypothetical protein
MITSISVIAVCSEANRGRRGLTRELALGRGSDAIPSPFATRCFLEESGTTEKAYTIEVDVTLFDPLCEHLYLVCGHLQF